MGVKPRGAALGIQFFRKNPRKSSSHGLVGHAVHARSQVSSGNAAAFRRYSVVTSDDVQTLLAAAKAGDELAATRLYQLYVRRLLGLAKRLHAEKLNGRCDEEDVVQSAMRTFFVRLRTDRIQWDENVDLWKLLARITNRKVCRQVDLHTAAKRTVDAEQNTGPDASDSGREFEAFAREPTASDVVIAEELLERILEPLEPAHRQIVELRLEGRTFDEISHKLGCSESQARRLIDKLERAMKHELDQNRMP